MKDLEGHRLANYFPPIEGDDFNNLVASIKKNGQLNPIILYEGKILDGKNRYRACKKLGIEPITVDYTGTDPLAFVVASNIDRRHLTESQKAIVALEMLPEYEKQAKERMRLGGSKGGKVSQNKDTLEKEKPIKRSTSTEDAGKQFGISGSTVQSAKRIKKAVDDGELDKSVMDDIKTGKKTVNKVDKELHDKRFVKKEKEQTEKENKTLPMKYPKFVSNYLDYLKAFKHNISEATRFVGEGMFSPEALQFTKRLHEKIKILIDEFDEVQHEKE